MPCKSNWQKLLEGVKTALTACLWKMKIAEQKSRAIQTNPTHQLSFNLLITAILLMKKLLSSDLLLINLNLALVCFQLRKSAITLHAIMAKNKLNGWSKQVLIMLNLIDEVSLAQYAVPRIRRPQIATISKTYKVLMETTEDVFMICVCTDVTKEFFSLADAIKNHYIFYNNSNNPQAPVKMQLIVALVSGCTRIGN
ncbi:hypothetical protein PTTG_06523 [Puccinia triticina 1-1 BBBD Race 1]|uniref:Uncharacterized protein n=1 Tax=Puccinia triticina (isolate 1-1 / race 1 (BBBD)) TaxID=630390 RepID=A0A0C4F0A7_PUCT1|nr:hypothetical protein PTTG_06523 [Puccinia triticina 1-1 BBBD Race 1]